MAQKSDGEILVVEDDALTRRMLVRVLASAGYRCRESENGSQAWDQLQHAQPPALVLLDLEMPGLNGSELLKRLRADRNPEIAQIPTIMLTGHGGVESEVLCLETGADDFVTKPINITVLRARIETHLRLRSMRDQLRQQNEELEAWRHNLERDLAAARLTQQSLIPQKPPILEGWKVAAAFRPVIEVGGDIYGWLPMKDGRMLFWIADATGHGASAALLTTLSKLLFHYGSSEHEAPAEIMRSVNDDFRGIFGGRSFMTAMCVALDLKTGRASVVGAGHPPLLVARINGQCDTISSVTPPLGLTEQTQFAERNIELNAGDAVVLYTDGLFAAGGENRPRLTPARLAEIVELSGSTAESVLSHILDTAAPKEAMNRAPDDIAVVVVRRTP
jgi:phosphoserine phosphatase RsbU/P